MHRVARVPSTILLGFLCLGALAACGDGEGGGGAVGASAPSALRLVDRDNGQAVRLAREGALDLQLSARPTTGHQWDLEFVDVSVLRQDGPPGFLAPAGESEGASGLAGAATWAFRAVGPGTTKLRLIYHRAWEEGVEPARVYEVEVTVP